jgi:hypothetical protein
MKTLKHIAALHDLPGQPHQSFFKKSLQIACTLEHVFTFFHTLLALVQKCYAQETIGIKRLTRGLQSQQKRSFFEKEFFL